MIVKEYLFLKNATLATLMAGVGLAALGAVTATALAYGGLLPFIDLAVSYGGAPVPWAGAAAQTGVAALLLALAAMIPGALRVARLETSHRRFEIDMDDVTRAYRAAHMADRAEIFGMQREFDAVRERYRYIQTRPDLQGMDSELLTIAAQMSAQSRDLAEAFSVEALHRVRHGLEQRRRDIDRMKRRLETVRAEVSKLSAMNADVADEETRLSDELSRMESRLNGMMHKPATGSPRVLHLKSTMPV